MARSDSRRRPRCRRCCWSRCSIPAPHCRRWSASRHSPPPTRSSSARTGRPAAPCDRSRHRRRAHSSCVACHSPHRRWRYPLRRRVLRPCRPRHCRERSMKGSVSNPINRFIASKVVCCEPVGSSPEASVRPAGVNAPNTRGMPPVELKKLTSALATFCWLMLRPLGRRRDEVQRQIEKGVRGVIAQAGREIRRQVGVYERTEGAADAAGGREDGILLRDIGPCRVHRTDSGAAQGRRARDIGERRRRRIEQHQILRAGLECEIAGHGHRRAGRAVAGREGAASHRQTAHRSRTSKRSPGDVGAAIQRARIVGRARGVGQEAGDRRAGIVVEGAGIRHRAGPGQVVDDRAGVGDDVTGPHPAIGDGRGGVAAPAAVAVLVMLPAPVLVATLAR